MEESLDVVKLTKLFSYGYDSKIDVEFTEDEVNEFNTYVKNNDISSIAHFLELKGSMCREVFKDIVHSKVDSFWQYLIDCVYNKYDIDNSGRECFLKQSTDYEKSAVMFGIFNYQVEKGGLFQWHNNGYSEDLGFLYEFLDNCDYDKKDKFMQILDDFSYVKIAIEELDPNDDWYNEDRRTRLKSLEYNNKEYYSIQNEWRDYFENYLINNMPDEYKQKIIDYGKDIRI